MKNKRQYNLTSRELEVARLTLMGYTDKKISIDLKISSRTVEQHITNVKMKLGAKIGAIWRLI